jgi:hypothetical protein
LYTCIIKIKKKGFLWRLRQAVKKKKHASFMAPIPLAVGMQFPWYTYEVHSACGWAVVLVHMCMYGVTVLGVLGGVDAQQSVKICGCVWGAACVFGTQYQDWMYLFFGLDGAIISAMLGLCVLKLGD